MTFIFIFTKLLPNWVLLIIRILGGFLSGSVPGFPLKLGQDVLWSSMWKGEEGRQPGITLTPIASHTLPGASHFHSGREEVFLYSYNLALTKTCQGREPGYSVTFRGSQRAFPFSQTKKAIDPGFSLREEEKA